MALSCVSPLACASALKRSITRCNSSIAPPRRWRYCCAYSGACEATTAPSNPKAKATMRIMRDKGNASSCFKSVHDILFHYVVQGLRDLVGARPDLRLHHEDHGF